MKIYDPTSYLKIFFTSCFEMLSSDLYPDCRDYRYLRCMSFVNFSKTTGRTVGKMWFVQDVINLPARIENFCHNNLLGSGHELVATGYLDHLYRVLKSWCFGLGNVVFGGVVVEVLSLATPSRLYGVKIFQGGDMSFWKFFTLIICDEFWQPNGLYF